MAIENCNKCEAFGFVCRRGGFFERLTGREKVVVLNDSGQEFAHDFSIETCEVVTDEVPVKKYATTLMKYINARNMGLIYPL